DPAADRPHQVTVAGQPLAWQGPYQFRHGPTPAGAAPALPLPAANNRP
ncbi:MAG: hypothetical protein H7Z21_04210, partial [Hymenobacter sp.]|nr:hypothetical protein [Hymenobacter sp.]